MADVRRPPLEEFDAEVIQKRLFGVLRNIDAEIERRLRRAQTTDREMERQLSLLLIMLRFTSNSYDAVCFLLATTDDHPKRKARFAFVVPPVNRQLMDMLFTLVFMIDDFPARSLEYEIAGYRQLREEYDKLAERFGTDPNWQVQLRSLQNLYLTMERYFPLKEEQKVDPSCIVYWRAASKLKNRVTRSQDFLEYFYNWLYDDTSSEAHLNAAGLFKVGGFLLSSLASEEMKAELENRVLRQYTFQGFTRTLIVVLAIASEIEIFLRLENRQSLAELWTLLAGYVEEAKHVYEQRYQELFVAPRP